MNSRLLGESPNNDIDIMVSSQNKCVSRLIGRPALHGRICSQIIESANVIYGCDFLGFWKASKGLLSYASDLVILYVVSGNLKSDCSPYSIHARMYIRNLRGVKAFEMLLCRYL